MTPADRIASLEAELEGLQTSLAAYINTARALPAAREEAAEWKRRWEITRDEELKDERDAKAAREEAKGLREALVECAQGVDADGAPCWCCIPSMIPYRGHDAGCEAARAALERKP